MASLVCGWCRKPFAAQEPYREGHLSCLRYELASLGRTLREETAALLTKTRTAVRRSVALRARLADERSKR